MQLELYVFRLNNTYGENSAEVISWLRGLAKTHTNPPPPPPPPTLKLEKHSVSEASNSLSCAESLYNKKLFLHYIDLLESKAERHWN